MGSFPSLHFREQITVYSNSTVRQAESPVLHQQEMELVVTLGQASLLGVGRRKQVQIDPHLLQEQELNRVMEVLANVIRQEKEVIGIRI